MHTPWGKADYAKTFARGFHRVGTPSHGGFMISRTFAANHLSPHAIKHGIRCGTYLAYEEDVAWAIPALELHEFWPQILEAYPEDIQSNPVSYLVKHLSPYKPGYLLERGIEPDPEGYARWRAWDTRDRMARDRHPDLIVSAIGAQYLPEDEKPCLPVGDYVRVTTADGRFHIVTTDSYRKRPGPINLLSQCDVVSH